MTATEIVATHLDPENELGITADMLEAIDNPHGEGEIVFIPQTRWRGVRRTVVWVVIDGEAYAINAPSKLTTPELPWPREAERAVWERTGLDPYQATKAIGSIWIDYERT